MRIILVSIFFLVSISNIHSQDLIKQFIQTCEQMDYDRLTDFIKEYTYEGNYDSPFLGLDQIEREVVNDYWEEILPVKLSYTKDPVPNEIEKYRLFIIREKNQIAYLRLEGSNENEGLVLLEKKHKVAYASFLSTYEEVFCDKLVEEDLFENQMVFGFYCGYSGEETDLYYNTRCIVAREDDDLLINWLKCANPVLQLYAIVGMQMRIKDGKKYDDFDMNLIKLVLNKQGNIQTCSGCIYLTKPISQVLEIQ